MSSSRLMEINLLPRREKIGYAFKAAASALLICAVLGPAWLGIQYYTVTHSLERVQQELDMTKKLHAAKEKNIVQGNVGSAASGLSAMIPLVEQVPVSAVSVLNRLVALLPQRGFVLDYQYSEGAATMTVQFDTLLETSAYLNQLNRADWVEGVVIPGVAAGSEGTVESTAQQVPKYTTTFQIALNKQTFKDMEGQGK
ncbi:hypothetical protein [Paenibacillus montanisoli]|uniref:Fimbrial assembly protein n=1 Tax=Paenibacillus montanisoli TaxID=2081970 RepID=A0A328U421_9BACL|nr:hypothetical protein [Paenibacillus montanisoli]RAP74744.1 hypothetical protein DL346_22150 [Paenibacillus montanisoli]